MKAYLITTGVLFGLLAGLHVWRVVDEWPHVSFSAGFVLLMGVLIVLPAALSAWAFSLLKKLRVKS